MASKQSTLDQWLSRKKKSATKKGIEKMPSDALPVLSYGQERLWLLEQLYPDQCLYSYAHRYVINGPVQIELLIKSFNFLAHRHDILRSTYRNNEGSILQEVTNALTPDVRQLDFSTLNAIQKKQSLESSIKQFIEQPFNLSVDSPLRLSFFKLDDNRYEFIIVMHHIMGDAGSLSIINKEVSIIYKSLITNETDNLEPLKIQYKDFSYWQRNQGINPTNLSFWKEKLSGDLPSLDLPIDRSSNGKTFKGKTYRKKLGVELSGRLKELTRGNNVTMYALMLAAYKLLLSKYTRSSDIIVASPFSNRDHQVLEKLVGFFNETLVLRTKLNQASDFLTLMNEVNQGIVEAMAHKNMPIDVLVNELKLERQAGENPLFQTMFLYGNTSQNLILGDDVVIEENILDTGISKFDLTLFANDHPTGLELAFEHTVSFSDGMIEAMATHFETLLSDISQYPQKPLSKLSILTASERTTLTENWAKGESCFSEVDTIHQLIAEQVKRTPEAKAIQCKGKSLTYAQLDRWSDQVAALLGKKGIEENHFVGLYTNRSLEMIVGILGILKAGGAYLPLDPDYPEERIKFMLSDTQASIVLTEKNIIPKNLSEEIEIISIDPLHESQHNFIQKIVSGKPDDNTYIIYTSGSTGQPKGVPVSHKNLIHSTNARFNFYKSQPNSFLLLSSFSFDSSVAGIFWTLCSGGKLVIPPKRIEQDLDQLATLIAENKISHTLLLPSLYHVLLNNADITRLTSLQTIIVAGEACSLRLKEDHFKLLPEVCLYNEYGPTETTVWCIAHEVTPKDEHSIPIGKPIQNTQVYILDNHLNPVPKGVLGELYIGGMGVTNGYLNRPSLTSERFIKNPFNAQDTLYKTGDLAKFRDDGIIDFAGRADDQVKIRGFRIELEEIREALMDHDLISDAVVIVVDDPSRGKSIVGYAQSMAKNLEKEVLRKTKASLPQHMIPSFVIILEELPRLPNGKIDLKQLPTPYLDKPASRDHIVLPVNKIQQILVEVWKRVLNLKAISISDNFFDLGGDSILSIQIISQARKEKLVIGPTQIFDHQTIESISKEIIWQKEEEVHVKEEELDFPIKLPLSYQQQAFLFHSLQDTDDQGFLQLEFKISGEIDTSRMHQAWQMVLAVHPIMRTSFHWQGSESPYQLIHEYASIALAYVDLTHLSDADQQRHIGEFKIKDRKADLNLQEVPSSRLTLFQMAAQRHLLCWTCHHISLDGWSATIIFKEALSIYESLSVDREVNLSPAPSFKQYLEWRDKQDISVASTFWKNMFTRVNPSLFSDYAVHKKSGQTIYAELTSHLPTHVIDDIHKIGKKERLTINTLLQGMWMITLSNFFGKKDVVLGLTLSGRSSDFADIDRMAGLLMNVLPLRKIIEINNSLSNWFRTLQDTLNQMRQYEYVESDKVNDWIDQTNGKTLFDNLFVFGNFMNEQLRMGDLRVDEFEGEFSSTFPLTLRVNPTKTCELNLRYNTAVVPHEAAQWLLTRYQEVIQLALEEADWQDTFMSHLLDVSPYIKQSLTSPQVLDNISDDFKGPQSATQLRLSQIWNGVLNLSSIHIDHNFFDLGGSSLSAIQMLNSIQKEFEKKISPSLFLGSASIRKLSLLIDNGESDLTWSSIVPIKTSGHKHPLFCIHSGGAHVMFYKGFAKFMAKDYPVYAIQPSGIDGNLPYHDSIENMASQYIREVKAVQPTGPYHLLGTCFSNAVGLEMVHQLQSVGDNVASLYVIDSAPAYTVSPSPNGERKPVGRMITMIKKGNWAGILKKIRNRYLRQKKRLTAKTAIEHDLDKMVDSLNKLYSNYTWKPVESKIILMRSTEFSQRKDKQFHLDQWNLLAKNGLEIYEVEGKHLTLFNEPAVEGLAKAVGDHLSQSEPMPKTPMYED